MGTVEHPSVKKKACTESTGYSEGRNPHDSNPSKSLNSNGIVCPRNESDRKTSNGTAQNDSQANQTVLQQHCTYFAQSRSGTDIIYPLDTYHACRAWDWSIPLCLFFAGAIHFVQSYGSCPNAILPDPFFRIWIGNLHKNKHGSDSNTFDNEGGFQTAQFERFFDKYGSVTVNEKGEKGMTKWDVWRGLRRQALALDFFGQVSAFFEWLFTYIFISPPDGILTQTDVQNICNGSAFIEQARKIRQSRPSTPTPPTQSSTKSQTKTAILSTLLVTLTIIPALTAGTCYFILRFVDDLLRLVRGYGIDGHRACTPVVLAAGSQAQNQTQPPTKSHNLTNAHSRQQPSTDADADRGVSFGGLLGFVVVGGITYLVLR